MTGLNSSTTSKPVILIFGPTAVGKTALLEALPEGLFEVINADSQQVYRHLSIGTAKPDAAALDAIPHHLVDIRDPSEQFNVSDFVNMADTAVDDILSRGKIPVLCGGTAFYFRNFLLGLPETPPSDPDIRRNLEKRREVEGLEVLFEELKAVDPEAAGRIKTGDAYRVQRALEVWYSSGRPLSSYKQPEAVRSHLEPLIIGLERDRAELYDRIDKRVGLMARGGLLREIRTLVKEGWRFDDPALQAIGYREFRQLQEAGCPGLGGTLEKIRRNTRRYAKRQITFFSSIKGIRWYHPDQTGEIISLMKRFRIERLEAS